MTRLRIYSARLALTTALLFISQSVVADDVKKFSWTDGFTSRLEALALIETLNSELLSHDSATLTLDRWCEDHHLASPARIVAERVHGVDKIPTAQQRENLGVTAAEPIRYRRVRLSCGGHVLSEADNWYVPSRLTPEMNNVLDTSDTAFGRAVHALNFHRRTISAKLLWSPLPQNWEMHTGPRATSNATVLVIPHQVLQHTAVLSLPDGKPISEVVETYTEEILNFPQP